MSKCAFLGFGEVNTPVDVIIRKCSAAEAELKQAGVDTLSCYPISDDYEEKDIARALSVLEGQDIDALVICIAGWIPSHAVIKITERYRHLPMALWGLCGWYEDGRLVTTADQAGTTALRATFEGLGYKFRYFYDIIGRPSNAAKVAGFCRAASAAKYLRSAKAGMGGYRDMQLYGILYDGMSLKRTTGVEIETFELLEVEQRYNKLSEAEKREVVDNRIKKWKFLSEADDSAMMKEQRRIEKQLTDVQEHVYGRDSAYYARLRADSIAQAQADSLAAQGKKVRTTRTATTRRSSGVSARRSSGSSSSGSSSKSSKTKTPKATKPKSSGGSSGKGLSVRRQRH